MGIHALEQDPGGMLAGKSVVVFYAPWCGDCTRSLVFEEKLSGEFGGKVSFYRMDAEKYEGIAEKYGVERYPTYVFFRDGKPLPGNLAEPRSLEEARGWLLGKMGKSERK